MAIRPYDFCRGEWPFAPTTFPRSIGGSPAPPLPRSPAPPLPRSIGGPSAPPLLKTCPDIPI